MKVNIVISRYNEDINWCDPFINICNIYNKGNDLDNKFINNVTKLDNIGRESHTYIQHIIDNYDNLADYTIFLQGNPFDHSPDIINDIHHIINNDNNFDFKFLTKSIVSTNLSGCFHHPGLPLIGCHYLIFGNLLCNLEFKFGVGAQFVVSKKNIIKRDKHFYEKIILLLESSISPIEGYVFERFWGLIFQ